MQVWYNLKRGHSQAFDSEQKQILSDGINYRQKGVYNI